MAAVMPYCSRVGLVHVAVADGRWPGESAFDEAVVHIVIESHQYVRVDVGVAGLQVDGDMY